jgi:NADH:ubiquinone oxidoreductase subunit 6 (subunit J)
LTLILLLIYIGAISVLFLFVVMMLKLNQIEKKQLPFYFLSLLKNYLVYTLLSLKLLCFIYFFNKKLCFSLSFFSLEFLKHNKDINNSTYFLFENQNDSFIFINLFSQKYFLLIIIGFTLLFSMVGSIALCLIKNKSSFIHT